MAVLAIENKGETWRRCEGVMHRELGRPSFLEAFLPESLGQYRRLERINHTVDWDRFGN